MPVFAYLFCLFIILPLVEIYVLIQVGHSIGALPTVALLVAISAFGAWILRQQGLSTLATVQVALQRGELPAEALLEGLVLLIAGALLLTPGLITDLAGFICLLPPVRRVLSHTLGRAILRAQGTRGPAATRVLDGDFRVEHEP